MRARLLFAAVAAALAACGATPPDPHDDPTPKSDGYRTTPIGSGDVALSQCTRTSPSADGPYWTPTTLQIAAVEDAVSQLFKTPPRELATVEAADRAEFRLTTYPTDFARDRSLFLREYTGYTIGGRERIYGSFFPSNSLPTFEDPLVPEDLRDEPRGVCDGGYQFFGVEYDVASGAIVRIAFNGSLEGRGVGDLTF